MKNTVKIWNLIIITLSLITLLIWLVISTFPDSNLHLIACDVGEGDAILLTFRSTQILIDGGPNAKVIDCLSENMPFWDRKIETVILSHPDRDHMAGLIDVFKRYKVNYFVGNNIETSKPEYQVLKSLVGGSDARVVKADDDTKMSMGKIYIDILNGIGDNQSGKNVISDTETNDLSLVLLIKYGTFEAVLTGDVPSGILEELSSQGYIPKSVNYIKISHHGSKTGLTHELLELIDPEVAVLSVGKNNYGHPTEEVIDLLEKKGIKILRTDLMGNIEISSNGKESWIEK